MSETVKPASMSEYRYVMDLCQQLHLEINLERNPHKRGHLTRRLKKLIEQRRDIYFRIPVEEGKTQFIAFFGTGSWHQRRAGHYYDSTGIFTMTHKEMEEWADSHRKKRPEMSLTYRELRREDV